MTKRRYAQMMLLCLLALTVLAGCTVDKPDDPQLKVIAQVGNTPITEAEFTNYMEQQSKTIQGALAQGQFDENSMRQFLFQRLIREEVALNEARQNGNGIDSSTTNKVYNALKWNTAAFSQMSTERSTEQGLQYTFASPTEYQAYLLRQNALDAWSANVQVPGAPESFDLQAIIIDAQTRSPEEALALANQAVQELQNGTSFGTVARKYSDSQSVQSDGGSLGFITFDPNDPESEPILAPLRATPLNQITQPLNLGNVVAILKPLAKAGYLTWEQLTNDRAGVEYVEQTFQEYESKGLIKYYVDPITIPLPASINK